MLSSSFHICIDWSYLSQSKPLQSSKPGDIDWFYFKFVMHRKAMKWKQIDSKLSGSVLNICCSNKFTPYSGLKYDE